MQTLQSCPIGCTNEPDTLSSNNDSLQTTPDSTLQKSTAQSVQQQLQQQQQQQISDNIANQHQHQNSGSISDTSSGSFQQRFDFGQYKARLAELNCLHHLQRYWQQQQANSENAEETATRQNNETANGGGGIGSYYANNILGYTFGHHFGRDKDASKASAADTVKETPLQKFYRHQQQKKMPAFKGRRGWCGCFQVSFCFCVFL